MNRVKIKLKAKRWVSSITGGVGLIDEGRRYTFYLEARITGEYKRLLMFYDTKYNEISLFKSYSALEQFSADWTPVFGYRKRFREFIISECEDIPYYTKTLNVSEGDSDDTA